MGLANQMLLGFIVGIVAAILPYSRKLFSYLDTLIHEVGHGIATLPFGAALPKIVIKPNASGEAKADPGQIYSLLPRPIALFLEKITRVLSLFSGYPFPIILGTTLFTLSFRNSIIIDPWILLSFAFISLGTVLWSGVRITDSPIFFYLGAAIVLSASLYFDLGWWSLATLAGYFVILTISKTVLSSAAFFVSACGLISFIAGTFAIRFPELSIRQYIPSTIPAREAAIVLLSAIAVFALLSSRTFFTFLVVLGFSCLLVAIVIQPFWSWRISVMFLAGAFLASGVMSFVELYKITFRGEASGETDLDFATEEFGANQKIWYMALIFFTTILAFVIVDLDLNFRGITW